MQQNPMNILMQLMSMGQNPQQITNQILSQNPQLKVVFNQMQQSVFREEKMRKSIEKSRIFGTLCAKVPKFTKNS